MFVQVACAFETSVKRAGIKHVSANAFNVDVACSGEDVRPVDGVGREHVLLVRVVLDGEQFASKDGKQLSGLA
jgi:hypothetical protein